MAFAFFTTRLNSAALHTHGDLKYKNRSDLQNNPADRTETPIDIHTFYALIGFMLAAYSVIGKDFVKMTVGLGMSVALVMAIHYGITPPGE